MYYLQIGDKTERYADPREAGKAFYKADPEQMPSVTIKDGTKETVIADTFQTSALSDEEYKFRRLRTGVEKEEGFVSGYYEELENSLDEKLKAVDWQAVKPEKEGAVPKLDKRIYDDLAQVALKDPKKAEKTWSEHAPAGYEKPVFVLTNSELQKSELKKEAEAEKEGSWNNFIEPEEAIERARQNRDREMKAEKERLGAKAEVKRQEVEELTETAKAEDRENRQSERLNQRTNFQKQEQTEKEKERQIELMEQVHKQFHSAGNKFHYKDYKRDVAFKDKESKLVTNTNDERVAKAMATVAAAKGWNTIRVSGHPDFQREVWLAGTLHGLTVRGYTPTERDMKLAEKELERSMKNQVAHDKERGGAQRGDISRNPGENGTERGGKTAAGRTGLYTGSLVSHGSAPYNNNPEEKESYFVTIETEQGRKTIWGKDLARSFEGNTTVQPGDKITLTYQGKKPVEVDANVRDDSGKVVGQETIQTHRNSWEVKTDQGKVVQGVAQAAANKYSGNPQQQQAVMDAMNKEISRREQTGRIPKVEQYDHAAPTRELPHERSHEQQAEVERTR